MKNKPIHISVMADDDGKGIQTSFYLKGATVGQLSMLNSELDILKGEIISRIKETPHDWEVKENEDEK